MVPKVTFIVPCYRLAHLLPACIESILAQTYSDFEVLIMDDCSPDNTAEVAQSFRDPRVKHIRNEPNIGHLKNYNKGIDLAAGEYVWLISPDDFLRRRHVLEQYVDIMSTNPNVGYVFCPAMTFQDGRDTELVAWSAHGTQNQIFNGREFLSKLLLGNCVSAPTGMVRKRCYNEISLFPLDLPNSGDWYLWCVFALHHDVAYFAEPMVCYRRHGDNMSENLKRNDPSIIADDNIAVRWTIIDKAKVLKEHSVVLKCKDAIVSYYAALIANDLYETDPYRLTLKDCERSLARYVDNRNELIEIRTRIYTALGDQCYSRYDFSRAKQFYRQALRQQPRAIATWIKCTLLQMGWAGAGIRRYASMIRS